MPRAHLGAQADPHQRPGRRATPRRSLPTCARRRQANSAPVDSPARAPAPAPPGVRGRPRPPAPLPHRPLPPLPPRGTPRAPQTGPAGLQPGPKAPTAPRGPGPGAARAPPPRARAFPGRRELLVPSTAFGYRPARPLGPRRGAERTPQPSETGPRKGGGGVGAAPLEPDLPAGSAQPPGALPGCPLAAAAGTQAPGPPRPALLPPATCGPGGRSPA